MRTQARPCLPSISVHTDARVSHKKRNVPNMRLFGMLENESESGTKEMPQITIWLSQNKSIYYKILKQILNYMVHMLDEPFNSFFAALSFLCFSIYSTLLYG